MKLQRLATALAAVAWTLTDSAMATPLGARPITSGSSHSSDGSNAGRSTTSPSRTLGPDLCVGLPRDTVLASCPAPCLPGAACMVYDQDAAHTKLTGCDYGTANSESFCSSADQQAQTCELHCFAPPGSDGIFSFTVHFNATELREPQPRTPEDFDWISTPPAEDPFQSNDFVRAVGKLQVADTIQEIFIVGSFDRGDTERYVDVALDPELLASASGVATVGLVNLPLGSDAVSAILVAAPQSLAMLVLARTKLTTLTDSMFAGVPQLETLLLTGNKLSSYPTSLMLPNLKKLVLDSNEIESFEATTPLLESLSLANNKLLCIPASVFTYQGLQSLDMGKNRLLRPLVLTAEQLEFLEALPTLKLELVEPPYPEIVTSLPPNDRNNANDSLDISQYLLEATTATLRGNPELPVLVVDSTSASQYNDILESRASIFDGIPANSTSSPTPTPTPTPSNTTNSTMPGGFIASDVCVGVPRNTLLANCPTNCPRNGACVAYDQDAQLSQLSGCDYDVSSNKSFCTNDTRTARTCEFQCFAVFDDHSKFNFLVPFKATVGEKMPRKTREDGSRYDPRLEFKTDEIPFLSNTFVNTVGQLTLQSPVTDVWISGGRTEFGTRGVVANMVVSPLLLSQTPLVTSLSLMNVDLRTSDVAAILTSAPPTLKLLNLRNALLTKLPVGILASTQQLETLTLAQNSLTTFDTGAAALSKLINIDLSENLLTTIDIKAPNLKMLDLSGNNLARLPLSVVSLTNLKALNLKNNAFTFPLVLSPAQVAFLNAVPDVQFGSMDSKPAPSTVTPTGTLAATTMGTGAARDSASLLADGGRAAVVKGVAVVIVSEQIANQFNDQLEQKQKESTPAPRTPSTGGGGDVGSTAGSTSSLNSTGLSIPSSPGASSSISGSQIKDSGSVVRPSEAVNSSSSASGSKTSTPSASKGDAATTSEMNSVSLATKLALGGVGSAFFVAVVVIILVIYKRRSRASNNKASSYQAMTENADGNNSLDAQPSGGTILAWWKDDALLSCRLKAGDISDNQVLASDSSSVVWLVNYRSGSRKLVSKRLIQGEKGPAYDSNVLGLVTEAKIASTLHCASIVPLVGVAWTNKTDLQVLYKYMSNGDLSSYLAQTDASTLSWLPEKLQLAVDIIEALVYAHSFNPPLLHRDLKSSNVLLDDNFKAKLGDFGSARLESDNDTMTTSEIGTGRWLAPEILLGSTSYGTPSDIYSFGVVLCELDTHQMPYSGHMELSEVELLQRVARGELRPSLTASCPPEIREIAESCLAFDPNKRPSAIQVAYSLRQLMARKEYE